MTSISATSSTSYLSPLQKLQDQLQAEVTSGTISSSDQNALSSALTDINSSLQSSGTGNQTGTSASPGDLKSKIDNLIAGEVSGGKLTSAQATELQGVFKSGDEADSDLVQRERQQQHLRRQRFVILGASDQLPNLTSGPPTETDASRKHPSRQGGMLAAVGTG